MTNIVPRTVVTANPAKLSMGAVHPAGIESDERFRDLFRDVAGSLFSSRGNDGAPGDRKNERRQAPPGTTPPVGGDLSVITKRSGGRQRPDDPDDNSTAGCQGNGGSSHDDLGRRTGSDGSRRIGRSGEADGRSPGDRSGDREKRSDNGILAVSVDGRAGPDPTSLGPPGEEIGMDRAGMDRLVRTLHESVLAGRSGIRFSVALESGGEVSFDVRIEGQNVHIKAYVDDPRDAAALTSSIGELKRRLEECGLRLGSCEIMDSTRAQGSDGHPGRTDNEKKNERRRDFLDEPTAPRTVDDDQRLISVQA